MQLSLHNVNIHQLKNSIYLTTCLLFYFTYEMQFMYYPIPALPEPCLHGIKNKLISLCHAILLNYQVKNFKYVFFIVITIPFTRSIYIGNIQLT